MSRTLTPNVSTTALTLLATLSHRYAAPNGYFSVTYRGTEASKNYHGPRLYALMASGLVRISQGGSITPTPLGMVYAKLKTPKPGML